MKPSASELYAQTCDVNVPDWDGELDFYRKLANETNTKSISEIAYGTGQIPIRLAQEGTKVAGLDHCMFRFGLEHLLPHPGKSIKRVYGDFFRGEWDEPAVK